MKKTSFDIRYRITDLDIEHMRYFIYRYCATVEHVQKLIGCSKRTAYAHISRWRDLGFAYSKSGYILFKKRAYIECGVPFVCHDIGLIKLREAAIVNEVEFYLQAKDSIVIYDWKTERELRREQKLQDTFTTNDVRSRVPDAVADIYFKEKNIRKTITINVETSHKGPDRTDETLASYAKDTCYDEHWILAKEPYVYNEKQAGIKRIPKEYRGKFWLGSLDKILANGTPQPRTQI